MTLVVLVVVLGGLGALLRALMAKALPPLVGTLFINLVAAFALGLSAAWTGVAADGLRIGLLGAASTWSTLANELALLLRERRFVRAGTYLGISLLLGVGAAWLGLQISDL